MKAAVVKRRQAPGFIIGKGAAGPVNVVEMILESDVGNGKIRRKNRERPSADEPLPWH